MVAALTFRLPAMFALVTGIVFAGPLGTPADAVAGTTASPQQQGQRDRHHRGKQEYEKGRVILPGAGPLISDAFAGIKAVVPKFEAKIQRTTATGSACGAKTCWPFLLSDPKRDCGGAMLPAFCLKWTAEVPPREVAVAVSHALQKVEEASIWREPPGVPSSGRTLVALALALFFAPLLLGFGAGRAMRALAPKHPGIRTLLGLIVSLAVAGGLLWWSLLDQPHPSAGDGILVAALLFMGIWYGGITLDDPRVLKLAVVGALVGVVGAEVALRQSVPEPPECWHGDEVKLLVPAASDRKCRGAFSRPDDAFFEHAERRAQGSNGHVLHIGDSMVFGSGVGEHETFVAQIDRADTTISHINLSSPDTGPDHYLLTLKNWLAARKPMRVVLYLYPGNDLADLDRPAPCCGGAALLRYRDDGVSARCERPVWQPSPVAAVVQSAPPFLVQVAAQHAHLGAMACAAIRPTAAQIGGAIGVLGAAKNGNAKTDDHLLLILAAAKSAATTAGARLDVVVLPERDGLLDAAPSESAARKRTDRLLAVAKKAGVRAHDGWPMLAALLVHDGASKVFANTHARDFHFSRATHVALGTWLTEILKLRDTGAAL
jgi:hypothetical protein